MHHTRLASPSSFCWNEDYPDCGKVGQGNIGRFGRTSKAARRYQCKTCKKTFVETKGTVFCGRHHSPETIPESLAWLPERNNLAAIRRVTGILQETVSEWLQEAAKQVEQVEALLLANCPLSYRLSVTSDLWSVITDQCHEAHPAPGAPCAPERSM